MTDISTKRPRSVLTPGIYQHWKGNTYHVLGISFETNKRIPYAQYIPQYGEYAGLHSHRPLQMFLENIVRPEDNFKGRRFTLTTEKDFINILGAVKRQTSPDGKFQILGISESTETGDLKILTIPWTGRRKGVMVHYPLQLP